MGEGVSTKSAAKVLLLFTLPLIMSGLFQQLFNWVDAFIVGNGRESWRWPESEPPRPSIIFLLR